MSDHIKDSMDVYFVETATSYYEQAVRLKNENRRAAAQEALLQARYWTFKCPAESILTLDSDITNLERDLY